MPSACRPKVKDRSGQVNNDPSATVIDDDVHRQHLRRFDVLLQKAQQCLLEMRLARENPVRLGSTTPDE